jgi:hypothetical protein
LGWHCLVPGCEHRFAVSDRRAGKPGRSGARRAGSHAR